MGRVTIPGKYSSNVALFPGKCHLEAIGMGTIALILLDRLSAKNTPNSSAFLLNIPKSSPAANG
jgi:hypothetical protein